MINDESNYDDWLDWSNLYETAYFINDHKMCLRPRDTLDMFIAWFAVVREN